jgi:ribonuclease P protein component
VSEIRDGNTLCGPSPGAAFPRESRLCKPAEFKRVFNRPVVSSDRWFKVLGRPDGSARARLGMAVSRQVDRRAVGRNRLKRVIRESFRRYFASHGPAVDFVVLPRAESATICNRQLTQSLEQHWARVLARLEAGATEA